MFSHSPYGWVSYLHRAATTYYLCCGQALEDLQGAGRIGLTHILVKKISYQRHTCVLRLQRLCQRVKRKTCFSVLQRVQPIFANLHLCKGSAFFPFIKAQRQNNFQRPHRITQTKQIRIAKTLFSLKTFAPILKNIKSSLSMCNVFSIFANFKMPIYK